jgi:hypothetical protein
MSANLREISGHAGSSGAHRRDDRDRCEALRDCGRGHGLARPTGDQARETYGPSTMPTAPQPAEESYCCHRRKWRSDGGEIASAHRHHLVEIAAPGACLHVGAHLSPSQVAAIVRRKDTSNRVTRHVAALRHLVQSCACLEHELLRRSGACLERHADLGVVQPAQLAHHECGALPVLKLSQVGDQLPQAFSRVGIRSPRSGDVHRLLEAGGRRPAPQQGDGLVVSDPVQPRLQPDFALLPR